MKSNKRVAVVEVLTVYAAGSIAGVLVALLLGVKLQSPLKVLAEQQAPDLWPLTWDLAKILFWQYGGWALCAGLLAVARGRSASPAVADRGTAVPARERAVLGLWVGALVSVPVLLVSLAQGQWQLGQTAPWRAALLARPWDLPFWVFMAVGSFLVIPLVEEAFYRGYVLGRLCRDWSPATAVVFTTALFAFSHGQYLRLDVLNLVTLLCVLWSALCFAVVTRATRSLWPAMLAHAVINVPMAPAVTVAAVVLGLAVIAAGWERAHAVRAFALSLFADARRGPVAAALAGGAAFAVLFQQAGEALGLLALPVLLVLTARTRWQRRAVAPAALGVAA